MKWPHKHLLDVDKLSLGDVKTIFEHADSFMELAARPVRKVPTWRGKSVILFFAEPSTRTRVSFDVAGKRLSADTFSISASGSSLQKGESLRDTVLSLEAMRPDIIVLRHKAAGAAAFVAANVDCSVINAGDGRHAHPTQALLDSYTIQGVWGSRDFSNKTILFIGDINNSRVARSGMALLERLGARTRVCAPRTLLPPREALSSMNAEVFSDLSAAIKGVNAVVCLRLQLERQKAGLIPSIREYANRYCLQRAHLQEMEEPIILHPGPITRGVDIASDLADDPESLILDQVAAGVAVRMALLHLFLAGGERADLEKLAKEDASLESS